MLLAPPGAHIPAAFTRPQVDWTRYWSLLHEMQRLRGQVYLRDGAIRKSALVDGRHESDLDGSSWHLLVLNAQNRMCGCARFYEYSRSAIAGDLKAGRCALSLSPQWSDTLSAALEAELAFSRDLDRPCVDLGGWALDEEIRGTTEALRVTLGTYAFWQMRGNAVCLSTATRRHCASSILRRIGGHSLRHNGIELPAYYDPQYNCEMELLKFYSWAPNPRYAIWVSRMKEELSQISIVARHSGPEFSCQDWHPASASATIAWK